jgi:hypothetical protein
VVRNTGADVLITNHPRYDGTPVKIPELAERDEDDAHPYVIGTDAVARYVTVAEECARATQLAERNPPQV